MNLRLRGLSKDFASAGGAVHRAVRDLSLDMEQGLFYTLLGPSGCGKTTLLRLIAGFERPTSGTIEFDGRIINDVPPYRRGFPMVFQSYALFPHMTVLDNVRYGLTLRGLPRAEIAQRVERVLRLLGIETQQHKHPGQLSGGQQQRVALARALVLEPQLLLLDEPLSNIDAGLRVSMRSEIRALQQRLGITALYVTHDQEEALAVSDRVVVMNDGRIEQVGSPIEIHQTPATPFVARFMGCPNIFPLDALPAPLASLATARTRPVAATAVMIRSEAIELTPVDAGPLHATMEDVTFLGARVQYVLRLEDGARVTIDRPAVVGSPLPTPGAATGFDVRADMLYFF